MQHAPPLPPPLKTPATNLSTEDAAVPLKRFQLEAPTNLSRSLLWKIQRNYYQRLGVDAWRKGLVPHYITSNAWVAQLYAQITLGHLRDIAASQPDVKRVNIIELGAGSGRFSFHFIKKFFDLHSRSTLDHIQVRLVMTDLVAHNVAFWQQHPALAPYVASGQLDFAQFDVENPHPIHLIGCGDILVPGQGSPIIVFANYVFDTVQCDLFSLEDGMLHEQWVAVNGPTPQPDFSDGGLIKKLTIDYEEHVIDDTHYQDSALNQILAEYKQEFLNGVITIPSGAIRCLEYLASMAGGQLLALVADRGHNHQQALIDDPGPAMAIHDGCFSLMVNFHALGRWVALQGGLALHPSSRSIELNFSTLVLGRSAAASRETVFAFSSTADQRGPETFHMLKTGLDKMFEHQDLDHIMAVLRLCEWDASPFMTALPHMVPLLAAASATTRRDLRNTIDNVWNLYYPLGEENDLAFNMAGLLYEMGFFQEAAGYLRHSLNVSEPDPGILFNLARCAYRLQQFPEALELTNKALELDPNFTAANMMRTRLLDDQKQHVKTL